MVFMSDVTQILNRLENGDPNGASELLQLVYVELYLYQFECRLTCQKYIQHSYRGRPTLHYW